MYPRYSRKTEGGKSSIELAHNNNNMPVVEPYTHGPEKKTIR